MDYKWRLSDDLRIDHVNLHNLTLHSSRKKLYANWTTLIYYKKNFDERAIYWWQKERALALKNKIAMGKQATGLG